MDFLIGGGGGCDLTGWELRDIVSWEVDEVEGCMVVCLLVLRWGKLKKL